MGFLLKTLIGLILVLVIGSYIVDSSTVSTALQAGQATPDPLVSGARVVKQEVRNLTDKEHQEIYKQALQQGLKKAADVLNQLSGEADPQASDSKDFDAGDSI